MSRLTWEGLSNKQLMLRKAAERYHSASQVLEDFDIGIGIGTIFAAKNQTSEVPEINEAGAALKELDNIRTELEITFAMHPDIIIAEIIGIISPKSKIQIKEAREKVRELLEKYEIEPSPVITPFEEFTKTKPLPMREKED